jgi:hypothetical protein
MLHAYLMNYKYIIMYRTHSTYVTEVMKLHQDPLKPEQTTQFLFQLRGSVGVRILHLNIFSTPFLSSLSLSSLSLSSLFSLFSLSIFSPFSCLFSLFDLLSLFCIFFLSLLPHLSSILSLYSLCASPPQGVHNP